MSSQAEEDFYRPPEHLFCLVCGKEVVGRLHPQYCQDHLPLYEVRQREGVTTDELSLQWEDNLDNWHERPPELDTEMGVREGSTPFLFEQREGDWVVFLRYYAAKYGQNSRYPDSLAVNLRTGEIRRFVEIAEEELFDDLHGVQPALQQVELAAHWGDSAPVELGAHWEDRQGEDSGLISIPALVQAASFPVYGLESNPLGLMICSLSWGGSDRWPTGIGFTFSSSRYPEVRENLELSSQDAKDQSTAYQPIEPEQPPFWRGECRIAERLFSGEIRSWTLPQEEAQWFPPDYPLEGATIFYLKGEETILSGVARGPSIEELLGLLQNLVPLSNRADILEQYQRELDEEDQRLFGG